jgi:hypothetical protein
MLLIQRSAIAAILLCLAGCVATEIGPLQTRYDNLATREAAAGKLDSGSVAYARTQEELSSSYSTLAASAYAISQESGQQPATRASALTLAAVSAWKGSNEDVYGKAQPAGEAACGQLPGGTAGAPRDCAFLKYLPTLRAYDQLAKTYNSPAKDGEQQRVATLLALLPQIDAIRLKQQELLPIVMSGAPPYANINPDTMAFFKKIAFASACLAKLYYTVGNTAAVKTEQAIALSRDGQALASRFSDLLVQADVLKVPNPDWYKDTRLGIVCTGASL